MYWTDISYLCGPRSLSVLVSDWFLYRRFNESKLENKLFSQRSIEFISTFSHEKINIKKTETEIWADNWGMKTISYQSALTDQLPINNKSTDWMFPDKIKSAAKNIWWCHWWCHWKYVVQQQLRCVWWCQSDVRCRGGGTGGGWVSSCR